MVRSYLQKVLPKKVKTKNIQLKLASFLMNFDLNSMFVSQSWNNLVGCCSVPSYLKQINYYNLKGNILLLPHFLMKPSQAS